jgi:hypothetical protein
MATSARVLYDPAVAKKPKRPKATTPGIAQKIIKQLNDFRGASVVDLGLFRQARDMVLDQRAEATEGLQDLHPFHALYTYMVKTVTNSANALGQMPELSKLMERIEAAEEEYQPEGPPMSPITRSYFLNWTLFDMVIGVRNESFGSCVAAVSRALGSHPAYVAFVEQLCRTRPGIYVHEGRQGKAIVLREMVTNQRHLTFIPSGYEGSAGDLLLLRLLPAFLPEFKEALVLTTPYQIIAPRLSDWDAYFDRTLPTLGSDRVRSYEVLMKHGTKPHGARYWTEYIFEAYANHQTEVVFLEGLPDVAESRPHSDVFSEVAAAAKLRTLAAAGCQPSAGKKGKGAKAPGQIFKTLPMAELQKLPKLSETILEFGKPILEDMSASESVANLKKALKMVEIFWNAPLLIQHGDPGFARTLTEEIDSRFALMPQEVRLVFQELLAERSTTYGYDPRLASLFVKDHGGGDIRVHAESRLLDGPPEGWVSPVQ